MSEACAARACAHARPRMPYKFQTMPRRSKTIIHIHSNELMTAGPDTTIRHNRRSVSVCSAERVQVRGGSRKRKRRGKRRDAAKAAAAGSGNRPLLIGSIIGKQRARARARSPASSLQMPPPHPHPACFRQDSGFSINNYYYHVSFPPQMPILSFSCPSSYH